NDCWLPEPAGPAPLMPVSAAPGPSVGPGPWGDPGPASPALPSLPGEEFTVLPPAQGSPEPIRAPRSPERLAAPKGSAGDGAPPAARGPEAGAPEACAPEEEGPPQEKKKEEWKDEPEKHARPPRFFGSAEYLFWYIKDGPESSVLVTTGTPASQG